MFRRRHPFEIVSAIVRLVSVNVVDFLISEFCRWQAQQADNEKILGDNYICLYLTPDNFIVQQSKSVPTSAEKISLICISANGKLFLRGYIIKTLKDEGFNAHSFRHTHATRLIENGAPAKGVAGRLGHSNILITQNLYTHNTIKLQEETAMIFDNFLQTN
ncbi:MAG: tyrosine-type recombinase/integrase [Selenomonadaceae bacterium]|nr:tyrosine-type recombinase/integrase [Selenomonadaceae bacterium]